MNFYFKSERKNIHYGENLIQFFKHIILIFFKISIESLVGLFKFFSKQGLIFKVI